MRRLIASLIAVILVHSPLFACPSDSLLANVYRGNVEGVRTWIEHPDADVNAYDGTPLFVASRGQNPAILRLLLDHGARTENVVSETGVTPVHNATAYGPDEMLTLLLDHGAPILASDNTGATPLHWAAVVGSVERTRMLLDAGSKIDARSKAGLTAWDIAVNWNRQEVADFVRDRGASTDSPPPLPIHGPYLGETPPGDTPKRFAADLLALPFANHGPIRFSQDGRELIGSQNAAPVGGIWSMRETGEGWSAPSVLPSSVAYEDCFPVLNPKGDVLYFHSKRPLAEGEAGLIWQAKRTGNGWSDPEMLKLSVPEGQSLVPISMDNDGWLYGYAYGEGINGGTDVFRVHLSDPNPAVNLLPIPVNGEYGDLEPAIAPDGSYLVFASTRPTEGIGRVGLFVSFRLDDESWSNAIPLGPEINAPEAWRAFITRDGKNLFFQRAWNQYYWVSTSVIERIRP